MIKSVCHIATVLFLAFFSFSCEQDKDQDQGLDGSLKDKQRDKADEVVRVKTPVFDADSAYAFIEKQVAFGPRVPNTPAHDSAASYLSRKLGSYGFDITEQTGEVQAFNGARLKIKNIIGRYKPELDNRVLLFAHYDTRPFADKDLKDVGKPIMGANDGGSGVGVLLEIARNIQDRSPERGVDIIFFDAEDYGQISTETGIKSQPDSWCLGTQYWAKNPPIKDYSAKYGILLDMVGAKNAVFPKEGFSNKFAAYYTDKIWDVAEEIGYGKYFLNKISQPVTDDHLYVSTLADIPSLDIIHYDPEKNVFGDFHHTHADNMEIIDKQTLKAVGQTVLEVIYRKI